MEFELAYCTMRIRYRSKCPSLKYRRSRAAASAAPGSEHRNGPRVVPPLPFTVSVFSAPRLNLSAPIFGPRDEINNGYLCRRGRGQPPLANCQDWKGLSSPWQSPPLQCDHSNHWDPRGGEATDNQGELSGLPIFSLLRAASRSRRLERRRVSACYGDAAGAPSTGTRVTAFNYRAAQWSGCLRRGRWIASNPDGSDRRI